MPKFHVSYERQCVIDETLTIEIEAPDAKTARKIAREKLHSAEVQDSDGWEASDTEYKGYAVEGVDPA